MKINGKRFLLTGASGGIGQALAKQLSAAGAELILVGRNISILSELADSLSMAECIRADLSCEKDIEYLSERLKDAPLDGLIHAAGLNKFATLENISASNMQAILHTNLLVPMLLSQLFLPQLLTRPEAIVLNVGSTFGSIGYAGYSTYCASKFGLRGFSEALRRELADSSVKVLYVAPRATKTAMNSDAVQNMNRQLAVMEDSPELVARCIMQAIESERPLTYLGWPEKFFARINGVLPSLVDKSLKKQLPTIKAFAAQKTLI